ncbi:MAG: hypothetical protein PQ612_02955 [Rickettsiales bacterium]|nr:hypothetical protein [Pseudomonadota bacterium]MDA0965929.1 hypothetical protein [Pseudomonadota bacterium]MDG4542601.1 hypothetical protein [Rickettsiales bacterium]MDG4545105.1 hypothetical protein [Rickettsiales bacterium]MDG4547228.1 hypothetical protein [Rickettsiales bacterium]
MVNFQLAQSHNKTQILSANKVVSGALIVAGTLMVGKAKIDRHNELNRKMPFFEAVNEELKKFAQETQMKMIREQMYKEIKENVNKHSKSLMGFMTGFSLLTVGVSIAFANSEKSPVVEEAKNNIKGAVEIGALTYALGFALGVAGTGIYSMATNKNINADTISGAVKNGHMVGSGTAIMGLYIGSQKGFKNGIDVLSTNALANNELTQTEKILNGRRGKRERVI